MSPIQSFSEQSHYDTDLLQVLSTYCGNEQIGYASGTRQESMRLGTPGFGLQLTPRELSEVVHLLAIFGLVRPQSALSIFQKTVICSQTVHPVVICEAACYQPVAAATVWRLACRNRGMRHRILIIDDDDQLVNAYSEYLSGRGYQVDCAQELEEAQTLLAHFPYSVVITDLRLSKLGFGGLDLVKHIREQSLPIRIIVLTAYGWPELKTETSVQGADAFLRKPTRLAELGATVCQLTGAKA